VSGVIALPSRVVRDDVARLWRELAPLARGATRVDLAGVREIDSAGMALVLELAAVSDAVIANVPARYAALAAAHRVPDART
jgi:phospholipid transport system transporter-binding protein